MHNIILFGPELNPIKNTHAGGYSRNMSVYLHKFSSNKFKFIPCYHTVHGNSTYHIHTKFIRLLIDIKRFIICLKTSKNIFGIHILAQYRSAIIREFFIVIISLLFKKHVIYEIKAGAFIAFYENSNILFKLIIKIIIKNSSIIFVEGKKYIDFLYNNFGVKSIHIPNFIPYSDLKYIRNKTMSTTNMKILFVGNCIKSKGVFELVEACKIAKKNGLNIELTLIGLESRDFKGYLDKIEKKCKFKLNRFGLKKHSFILDQMGKNHIYIYPTYYPGEGHNNSITEAMMMKMIIITTKEGFLTDILTKNESFFVRKKSIQDIVKTLNYINCNREISLKKGEAAYKKVINNYTDRIVFKKIEETYLDILDKT